MEKRKSSTYILYVLLFVPLFFNCLLHFGSAAQLLPEDEVETLKTISQRLQIKNWPSINRGSCNGGGDLKNISANLAGTYCDCSFTDDVNINDMVCHVVSFMMKDFNMTGILPPEFANLKYLQAIDFTRNYIGGSLPKTLGQLNLTILSLTGNRINGSIPDELSEIATLKELVLENNQLQGSLPPSLGKLSSIERLLLSADNFSGTIPKEFDKLTTLLDFRIDGNAISGQIPDFIGNWKNLTRLDMQGTSLEGPFPSTISQLKNLEELRVSDLKGPTTMIFPNLKDMKKMERLILRNCFINGSIPDYIGDMTQLKLLDLSFNRLTAIPDKIGSLGDQKLKYLFLADNLLSQETPQWMVDGKGKELSIDVSYNNFTSPPEPESYCQSSPVNLVSSYSSSEHNRTPWCLKKDLPCSRKPKNHKLFINCGGEELHINGEKYEADSTQTPSSGFIASEEKWAYSTAGLFIGDDRASNLATTSSTNVTGVYTTARRAPTSLKYYGLCLRKGSYKVHLHFAEIMISNDLTSSSLGRRIFDVSIQGKTVLKDFNIAEKAKGIEKVYIEEIKDVYVSGSTMEIHLYWAGKGTNAIPVRGVYGPLISAITITPNYDPNTELSVGAILGIVAASCVVLVLILIVLRMKGFLGGRDKEDKELRALELQTGYFTLRQIRASTNNFSPANKIGEGGFGPVYKGVLSDGAVIAVKQLSAKSKQGNREFVNEIGMISALQHPNLVRLFGCCIEGNQLLLIYEYLENNSLARALFGPVEMRLNLDWPTRKKICLGIARGLAYLHEESRLKIVHRDIKATNVLLDRHLNAKISDFGLAKLDEEENTHISTRIAGTIGYMAPEYAMRGYLTDKADVYSFGIVALEIVSGKSNTNYRPKEEFVYLLDWAYVLEEQGNLLELVDPILASNYSEVEALGMLNLALLCTNPSPSLRPAMSSVVSMLDGKIPVQAPVIKRTSLNEDWRFKAFGKKISEDSQSQISTFSRDNQVQRSGSMDGPWVDSSISLHSKDSAPGHSASTKLLEEDLYDVNLI